MNKPIKKFPSVPPRITLPLTALVLEGGGTRGYFSSGVMDAFTEAGIMFPYIVGVSAGAANAMTYVAGQQGRSRFIIEHFVPLPQYVGVRNLLLHGGLFNYDFIFDKIANVYAPLDWEAFEKAPTRFFAGCIDIETGQPVYFEQSDYISERDFTPIVASCSVPLISRTVRYKGKKLLDGGVNGGIPIDKSIEDGNSFHVIIMTRTKGYVKSPEKYERLWKTRYRKYPHLIEAMAARHKIYARQAALCEQLEAEGKAMIIRPEKPLWESRSENSAGKLLALYDEGVDLGRSAVKKLLTHIGSI